MNWKAAAKSLTVWVNILLIVAAQVLTDPQMLALAPPDWMPRILQAQAVVNIILRYKTTGAIRKS